MFCFEVISSSHVEHKFVRRAGSESRDRVPVLISVGSIVSWALEAASQSC